MAWRSSGDTNSALINNLCKNKLITDARVKAAFLKVDRAHYASWQPYQDRPQSIGHAATISAPHMHAIAVEKLLDLIVSTKTRPTPRVLDIGSGSGYLTHVIAELVGDQGLVVGIDHISQLRDLAVANMSKSEEGKQFLSSGRVRFYAGDGRNGWSEPARNNSEEAKQADLGWDAIHVGASAASLHQTLLDQLRAPGRLFIPVDEDETRDSQHIWVVDKDADGNIEKKKLFGVRYVPLTDHPDR